VALRIDLVERLAEALRHPLGAPQVQALLQELRLEGGVRAQVLRALGAAQEPSKRRPRRDRGAAPHPPPARPEPPAAASAEPVFIRIKRLPRPAPAPITPIDEPERGEG
jgi:ATP-dependent RNA helicase SUPV3L1/SUV3